MKRYIPYVSYSLKLFNTVESVDTFREELLAYLMDTLDPAFIGDIDICVEEVAGETKRSEV